MAPDIAGLADSCCGCGACAAICPSGSIEVLSDECGFPRPVVDASCAECGLCSKVCPSLTGANEDSIEGVFWAKASDEFLLMSSSSGGVFGVLSLDVLRSGGAVYGVAFEGNCRTARHVRVCDEARLDSIMRSKYLQSAVDESVYRQVVADLRAERRVLFVGTACQIRGLKGFLALRKVCDSNLICVDIICHGVPSPKLWKMWLDFLAEGEGSEIDSVNFRSKSTGWLTFSCEYGFLSGKSTHAVFFRDWYMRAFLSNASLRPSCFSCFSKRACGSDITLGDFWGIRSVRPEIDYLKGVSAVVCNTRRGLDAFRSVSRSFEHGEVSFEDVVRGNPALVKSAIPYSRSAAFLSDVAAGMSISQMKARWGFQPSLIQKVRRKLGKLKRKAISMVGR